VRVVGVHQLSGVRILQRQWLQLAEGRMEWHGGEAEVRARHSLTMVPLLTMIS
jgi:hypothetical protein